MTARRLALLAAALVAPALAAPAVAPAKPVKLVSYTVTVEGTADYDRLAKAGSTDVNAHANFTWKTVFPHLLFRGHQPLGGPETPTVTSVLQSADATARKGNDDLACSTASWSSLSRTAGLVDVPASPGADPIVRLRMFGGGIPDFDACNHQAGASFDVNGVFVDGRHTYETEFAFPREAIGMGKVIQLVDQDVTDRRCPGNLYSHAASCRLSLEATVTFDKTNEVVIDDGTPVELGPEDLPPIPVPPGPPAPPAPTGFTGPDATPVPGPRGDVPAQDEDALVVPLSRAAVDLSADAGRATIPVTCRARCSGTVTATAVSTGAKARQAAARVLARQGFAARAGKARRVTLRFSRSARRAIRRAGGVKLTVTAKAGRTTARRSVVVRL